mgnify:CR=1 FL=1
MPLFALYSCMHAHRVQLLCKTGTPNTPKVVAWLQPYLDKVLPAKFQGSDINTLASAMVYDAEQALTSDRQEHRLLEGEELQSLYRDLPFPNGLGEV